MCSGLWPSHRCRVRRCFVRETTDHRSPLAVERISPGMRLPLLSTAVGPCPPGVLPAAAARVAAGDPASLDQRLRQAGAQPDRARQDSRGDSRRAVTRARSIRGGSRTRSPWAVPVLLEDTVLGAVVIRFAEKAVPLQGRRRAGSCRSCARRRRRSGRPSPSNSATRLTDTHNPRSSAERPRCAGAVCD